MLQPCTDGATRPNCCRTPHMTQPAGKQAQHAEFVTHRRYSAPPEFAIGEATYAVCFARGAAVGQTLTASHGTPESPRGKPGYGRSSKLQSYWRPVNPFASCARRRRRSGRAPTGKSLGCGCKRRSLPQRERERRHFIELRLDHDVQLLTLALRPHDA